MVEDIFACLRSKSLTTVAIVSITECSSEVDAVLSLARGPTGLEVAGCICNRTGGAFELMLCVVERITAMLQEHVHKIWM